MKCFGSFDPINPGESEIFAMDFVKELRSGDSLASVSWVCTVELRGGGNNDPSPQDHVTGVSTQAGTISNQRIAGTLDCVLYILTATAITTLGDTIKLWAYLPSFPPGAIIPTPI